MTYQTSKYIPLRDLQGQPVGGFEGGYVDNIAQTDMEDKYSPYLRNARIDGKGIRKRWGYQKFADTGGTNCYGMTEFTDASFNQYLIVRTDIDSTHKLAQIDSLGNVTPINTGSNITSTNRMYFYNIGGKLYCMNGADSMGILSDGIYKTVNTQVSLTAFTAQFEQASGLYINQFTTAIGSANITITGGVSLLTTLAVHTQVTLGDVLSGDTFIDTAFHDNIAYYVVAISETSSGTPSVYTTTIRLSEYDGGSAIVADTVLIHGLYKTSGSGIVTPGSTVTSVIGPTNSLVQHGLAVGDRVQFVPATSGGVNGVNTRVASPLASYTTYYVVSVPTDSSFTVSATRGGTPIVFTDLGSPLNLTTMIAILTPRFGTAFDGRLFLAVNEFPSRIYHSGTADPSNFLSADSGYNQNFTDSITAISANSQALLVFTRGTVWACDAGDKAVDPTSGATIYTFRLLTATEGAVNQASVAFSGTIAYYLSPSNRINVIQRGYYVSGFQINILSDRQYKGITQLMQNISSDQTSSFAYFNARDNIVKWHVQYDGATFNNLVIIYDIKNDVFLIDSGKTFYDGCMFMGDPYCVSNLTGGAYKDDEGTTDNGQPIRIEYITKKFSFGDPKLITQFWETRLWLATNPLARITQEIYVDNILVSTQLIDASKYVQLQPNGNATLPMATFPIGDESVWSLTPGVEDISEYTYTVSYGDLQKRGKYIQLRWYDEEEGSKIYLLNVSVRSEKMSPKWNLSNG